jgi:hypothetical protein
VGRDHFQEDAMMRMLGVAVGLAAVLVGLGTAQPGGTPLRFEVSVADGLLPRPTDGRVFVVLGKDGEPRRTIGKTDTDAPPCLGADGLAFTAGKKVILDAASAIYPLARLGDLPAGDYLVQAVFAWNRDLWLPNAPGNLFSQPRKVTLDPVRGGIVKLELTEAQPAEKLPDDGEHTRFLKFRSDKLSTFHKRDIYLRVGILLPPGFDRERERKYPLRVHIGGFGSRYTRVKDMEVEEDAPHFVLLHLDGAGPFGDPYQVNSANNGPYGDAVTQELIPFVEKQFRCISAPYARVLDGASTGGWVSLALQIFYPDFFNGAWSHCPDPVDFRAYELIDLYRDPNAFVNRFQHERPSSRTLDGDTRTTVRSEVRVERVLGRGDRWELSGLDWCSWNATFGPRGADGLPVPVWDGLTGKINKEVADHYRNYDLRLTLERNWAALVPKLQGKLNIWVGEADDYFLNNAVHLLDDFLSQPGREPVLARRITFGAGRKGHGWRGLTTKQMLEEMATRVEKSRPR